MELTVNIKESSKIAAFLNVIKEMDYVEILSVKEEAPELSAEHKEVLDLRLQRIEGGNTNFKSWEIVKKKYDKKAV